MLQNNGWIRKWQCRTPIMVKAEQCLSQQIWIAQVAQLPICDLCTILQKCNCDSGHYYWYHFLNVVLVFVFSTPKPVSQIVPQMKIIIKLTFHVVKKTETMILKYLNQKGLKFNQPSRGGFLIQSQALLLILAVWRTQNHAHMIICQRH